MKILYIGDIMGESGIKIVAQLLPNLVKKERIDLVIAQSENVTDGKSMLPTDMQRLQKIGVDFFTGGNHTPRRKELWPLLENNDQPVIGPANLRGCPGDGWKYIDTKNGKVLVISLLGDTFGNHKPEIDNPLHTIDKILANNKDIERTATVVNFHGDYSSEKKVMGYYLDGRVTAVIGDHWHVPTADAMILPKGTAHITDVGMCGALHSSLGVKTEVIISRWQNGKASRNELETIGPRQFNAALIQTDPQTNLAVSINHIQEIQYNR